MIEKPKISDEKIIASLDKNYPIQANVIEFLPIGNDASSFAYRVGTTKGDFYFLKLKRNLSNLAGFFVPRFLKDGGINQVIAPLSTNTHELWVSIDEFALVLYPFVQGIEAMKTGMSDAQWMEFGSTLKRIHSSKLPSSIAQYVKRETFIPAWSEIAQGLHRRVNELHFDDVFQKELAAFWKVNSETVQTLIEQTRLIGKHLQQMDLEFVLCHADIHPANILLTQDQDMFIVDWDDTLLAPKERDLMFVLGSGAIPTREEQMFFHGYGDVEINNLAIAYYRYEWCVQEIGDFGTRIFSMKDAGEEVKQTALEGFKTLFLPGDVVDSALNTRVEFT